MAKIIISINKLGRGIDVSCAVDIEDRDDTVTNDLAREAAASIATPVMMKIHQLMNVKRKEGNNHVH